MQEDEARLMVILLKMKKKLSFRSKYKVGESQNTPQKTIIEDEVKKEKT